MIPEYRIEPCRVNEFGEVSGLTTAGRDARIRQLERAALVISSAVRNAIACCVSLARSSHAGAQTRTSQSIAIHTRRSSFPSPAVPPIPNPLVCEECDNELNDCICGRADCRSCGEEAPVVELNANGGLCDGCMPDPDLERDCEESEQ